MKKLILILVVVLLLSIGGILFVGRTYFPDNVAETSPDGGTKQLMTRYYQEAPDEVVKITKEEISGLSSWGASWKLTGSEKENGRTTVNAEIPVLVFVDDLTVTISKDDKNTRVDVRSASRVGKSDFGENARSVRKLLAALDARLK